VQGTIEDAASKILGDSMVVHAAGRTDAGVHGRGMVAHADIQRAISPFRLMEAINAGLRPAPVSVIDCAVVPDDFHARFSCVARHYEYIIVNRRPPLTIDRGLAWRVPKALDADAMHDAAQRLVGRHNFTTFRSVHCQAESPVRTLDRLDVTREGTTIYIRASARSFLHHQVRSMVGCLSFVGYGKWSADDLRDALEAKNREALGLNAPPDGLYFMRADY
jgi:tRNA pseudouridine38-40 synthase